MTVKQLLNSLDSPELAEWQAHLNFEAYEKRIQQKEMDDEARSNAIMNLIMKGQ